MGEDISMAEDISMGEDNVFNLHPDNPMQMISKGDIKVFGEWVRQNPALAG